jgi:curved DNA-binding protein CbpA
MHDHYRTLQIQRNAHPEVVRAAFRTLLRVLGKHPDLGGGEADARRIIEAYETLADPERRQAYDLWLQAHSARRPVRGRWGLAPGVATWIRIVLPGHREAPEAPFAGRFDLVLRGPGPLGGHVYVRGYTTFRPVHWPAILTLGRAIRLVRTGVLPSTDLLLIAASAATEMERFLEEVERRDEGRGWNRCVTAVCTLSPLGLHGGGARPPAPARRMRRHLAGIEVGAVDSWLRLADLAREVDGGDRHDPEPIRPA